MDLDEGLLLHDLVLGLLDPEVQRDPRARLTPEQARAILPLVPAIQRHLGSSDRAPGPLDRALRSRLTAAQKEAIRRFRQGSGAITLPSPGAGSAPNVVALPADLGATGNRFADLVARVAASRKTKDRPDQ